MENRLTPKQLSQIVAEVDRLSQRRDVELDREQVNQILQELNLPSDLLEEALVQVQRREALAVQQRRNRWIAVVVAIFLVGAIAISIFLFQTNQQGLERISTYESRISLARNDTNNLSTVDKNISPEVYYNLSLKDAPLGKQLDLGCNWIDPSGQVAHQNRWQTQTINREVWNTYCRYQFHPDSVTGTWKVEMFLGNRTLSTSTFMVR